MFSGERVPEPLGKRPYPPETGARVQLPLPGAGPGEINRAPGGCAVARLSRGSAWLDTLDGQDSSLGKFSIERFIEEFPDLVSRVSEVSNGLAANGSGNPL